MSILLKPVELDKTFEAFEVIEDGNSIGMITRHKIRNKWAATMNTIPTSPLDYEFETKEAAINRLQMWAVRYLSG